MTGFGFNISGFGSFPNRFSEEIDASGGTITTSGAYTIHSFTSSGTFTVNSAPDDAVVDYLIIAGGGGGGGRGGGGGSYGGAQTGGNGGSGIVIIRYLT